MLGQPDAALRDGPGSVAGTLATLAGDIAIEWPRSLLEAHPDLPAVDAGAARALVEALVAALDDDLAPLIAATGLDQSDGDAAVMVDRLDDALRRIDAVRRAARRAARIDPGDVDDALATVCRQLAVQATATLAFRAAADDERARTSTEALAITVHELRRPLTVISSYAQLLSAGALGTLDVKIESAVSSMLAASEVMGRLIEGLAALSRLDDPALPSHLAEISLDDAITGAVNEVSTEAGLRDIAFDVDSPPGLRLRADRERLTLALTNLLSNAVKHSPVSGRVAVTARMDGDSVVVRVRDHGPGFSEKAAERLFEKYYRGPEERSRGVAGTGLGLYIVQAVAERHRGRAVARPAEGGGAEFDLILPVD